MDKSSKKIDSILKGKNPELLKVEPAVLKLLSKLSVDVQGREGEELSGTLNYHINEISQLIRKAGAIGYMQALKDNNIHHHYEISIYNHENRQGQIL